LTLSFISLSGHRQSFPSRMGDFRCQSVQCDTDTYLFFISTIRQNWIEQESCFSRIPL